jgi:hypothetical protein
LNGTVARQKRQVTGAKVIIGFAHPVLKLSKISSAGLLWSEFGGLTQTRIAYILQLAMTAMFAAFY